MLINITSRQKQIILLLLLFPVLTLLTACRQEQPLTSIKEIPLPSPVVSVDAYEGNYEVLLDKLILHLSALWGNKYKDTDILYYFIAKDIKIDFDALEKAYSEVFAKYGLKFERVNSIASKQVVYEHNSRIGTQTFVASLLPLSDNSGSILLLSLYPVKK